MNDNVSEESSLRVVVRYTFRTEVQDYSRFGTHEYVGVGD